MDNYCTPLAKCYTSCAGGEVPNLKPFHSLSHTHTHTHTNTHSLSFTLSLSLALSIFHTHTHIHRESERVLHLVRQGGGAKP